MFIVVLVVLTFFSLPIILLWLGFRRFDDKARKEQKQAVESNFREADET